MAEALGGTVWAITLFVDDTARSREFYARAFGVAPVHEDDASVAFRIGGLVVNCLQRGSAPELVGPAPVAPGPGPAAFQLTLDVADTDAVCALLAERGVTLLNGPVDRPWGPRTAAFADPDGHVWEVAAR
jgi:catechol 2,3-dioxygenase-like lactoylglutathione lyase family enzyme